MFVVDFRSLFLIVTTLALVFFIQYPSLIIFLLLAYGCARQLQKIFFQLRKPQKLPSWQHHFNQPFFAILGHVAKSSGPVSQASIQTVEKIMRRLRLKKTDRQLAINAFHYGKSTEFELDYTLQQLLSLIVIGLTNSMSIFVGAFNCCCAAVWANAIGVVFA